MGSLLVALFCMAGLLAVQSASGRAVEGTAEFLVRTGHTKSVGCGMYDESPAYPRVVCERFTRQYQSKATLRPDGSVVLCRSHSIDSKRCGLGNAGVFIPAYGAGKTVTAGRFSCRVIAGGVRCTVTATGKGFILRGRRLRGIGGADVIWH
jgi:hypothetical protein